ncbi:hypothetical protein K461DRAFT_155580 [Myriangium duriaei CBS 260.36]|uniref:Secreted protein n=1 Tax=Myriangium duriaei CBS 260.36 TaxID=1168546 RepID=A0A9P4IXG0_9PEZI|nr:hypothetical protein K461DRAFT_155580 [Myriangium duriaei CBS 260.36]
MCLEICLFWFVVSASPRAAGEIVLCGGLIAVQRRLTRDAIGENHRTVERRGAASRRQGVGKSAQHCLLHSMIRASAAGPSSRSFCRPFLHHLYYQSTRAVLVPASFARFRDTMVTYLTTAAATTKYLYIKHTSCNQLLG